jgi:hypothetical protein
VSVDISVEYLRDAIEDFEKYKGLSERALAQVDDEQFFAALDGESNSIAVIVKHLAGNLRSRWTDFLTTDGEKPDRNRDSEFEIDSSASRAALMQKWEEGWRCALDSLKALTSDDLAKTVYIRGEPHSVVKAIGRQLTHAAYHAGQIVFLAKHFAGGSWQTLSVPRGKSQEFNARMSTGTASNGR